MIERAAVAFCSVGAPRLAVTRVVVVCRHLPGGVSLYVANRSGSRAFALERLLLRHGERLRCACCLPLWLRHGPTLETVGLKEICRN